MTIETSELGIPMLTPFRGVVGAPGVLRRVPTAAAFGNYLGRMEFWLASNLPAIGEMLGFRHLKSKDYSEENVDDGVLHIAMDASFSDDFAGDEGGKVAILALWREARDSDINKLLAAAERKGARSVILIADHFTNMQLESLRRVIEPGGFQAYATVMRVWTFDGVTAAPCFQPRLDPRRPHGD